MGARSYVLKKYGLTEFAYRKMFEAQGGLCAICGLQETSTHKGRVRLLSVDHCHFSGKVRSLLCNRCNQTLGRAEDNPQLLRRMAEYLENKITLPPVYSSILTEAQKFNHALSKLPAVLQEVANYVFLHKLTQKEIADKLGKKQPWVSHQVAVILKSLGTGEITGPFSTREPRKRSTVLSLTERQESLKRRLIFDKLKDSKGDIK